MFICECFQESDTFSRQLGDANLVLLYAIFRSLPAFVWHRQDWAMIYPYVLFGSPEMSEMKSHSHFVAGFRDASVENRYLGNYIILARLILNICLNYFRTYHMAIT